ncbi:protein polybromo-1 [Octopus sinensis]|uniref:Protein polybromo-1 n=1 Tax=Octopus sinensis TaxID=2607531 RepID=A0A7E6FSZ7_9MOLL|nr:protein polybromo-1 [Octopus sinensis]
MPSKRKRPTQNVDNKNEDSDLSTPVPNKKKKKAPYDPIEICQDLYETIRNYKTEDGRLLCEAFIRAPKRRTAADYYDVVSTPIDLLKIQQKLKTDEYDDLEQFAADIELMVNNTKAYYRKSSQEYKDACDLWEIFQATRNELISEVFGDPSPAPSMPMATPTATTSVVSMPTPPTPQPPISCAAAAAAAATAAVAAAAAESAAAAAAATAAASASAPPSGGTGANMTPGPERRRSARKNQMEAVGGSGGGGGGAGVVMGGVGGGVGMVGTVVGSGVQAQAQRGGGGGGDDEDMEDDEEDDEMSKDGVSLLASAATPTSHAQPSVAAGIATTMGTPSATSTPTTTTEHVLSNEDALEINQLYTAIITAKDGERDISEVFQRLPPRSKYPKYYEIIKDPIDLKLIAQRIQEDYYTSVTSLEKDLLLMIKNAKTFNEPRSQVYRDAVALRKLIMNRKHESDVRKAVKSSARIRELQNIQKHCLKDQCETESDLSSWQGSTGSYDEDCFDYDDRTLWSLYFTVKNYKNALGQNLAEPFYKLPSQRQYPDYYEEIKQPMALFNVRKKIKKLKYRNLDELAADMNLIFENARHYNTDESSLYKT